MSLSVAPYGFEEKKFLPIADEILYEMKKTRSKYVMKARQAKAIYCFLLEVFILQFNYKSFNEKVDRLIDFINNELGLYFEFGMNMAVGYFCCSSKEIVDFFQKVKPNLIYDDKAYPKYCESISDKISNEKIEFIERNTNNRQVLFDNLDLNFLTKRLEKTFLELPVR